MKKPFPSNFVLLPLTMLLVGYGFGFAVVTVAKPFPERPLVVIGLAVAALVMLGLRWRQFGEVGRVLAILVALAAIGAMLLLVRW